MHISRFLLTVWLCFCVVVLPTAATAATVEELRAELQEKRKSLKETEAEIGKFKEEIQLKKKEARTLEDQIGLLDSNIDELLLNISRTLKEVDEVDAEVRLVKEEIAEREAEIKLQKARLADYIRLMNELDKQSSVTVFLKYDTFSEAINEAATFQEFQQRGQETLVSIQHLRNELDTKRRDLEDYQQTLEALKARQEKEQSSLSAQRSSKERLLDLTSQQEEKYQALLKQAQTAHQEAQAEIGKLDDLIREELRKQGYGNLPSVGVMEWPIYPEFGVSCEFHCSGYPYEYLIGPHTGTDIPAYVGTPIKAASDGYVARVHDAKGPGYSYVMILHGDNVSTVYGHLSGFAVNEGQMVTKGAVIGYSGGAPGMNGAGLSSGPHLHFEVRVNSQPVNARRYL